MDSIIEVKNLGKKYNIGERQGYVALRDVLTNVAKSPARWFGNKVKSALGQISASEFWALQDVNFEVKKGEVLGIIGRNGAGKSTLLKILSQITPPTTGEVKIRGRVGSLLEVGTGFHPELTGTENIFLNGAILGMRKKEIENKFDEIVEFAGVEKFLDTPVKRYSSGMYVRLAFAIAAHLESEILVIDEVLAVGDSEFQKKCLGKMEDVTKREGRTVLFVSHNMGAIQNFCSRTLLLDKGKIIEIGKTEKIIGGYLELNTQLGKISLKDRQDRKGDGRIIFKDVVFKDYHNKDVPYFRSGEDALIYIYYECLDPNIKDFYIGFSIDTFFNQNRVAFIGNKILKQKIIVQEDGVIKLRINKLPLNIGRYQFTLIAVDSGVEIYDWVQKAGEFDVEFGDYYNNGILPPAHDGFLLLDYSFDN